MKVRVGHRNPFNDAMEDRMDELGLNITNLHAKVRDDVSYEHIRKITRGKAFPSARALRVLCDALELDFNEMKRLVDEARVRQRYGDVLAEMTGRTPGLDRVDGLWKRLNREQKD